MRPPRPTTSEDVGRLRAMAASGVSLTSACRELQMSIGWVWKLNRKFDLGFPTKKITAQRQPKIYIRPPWTQDEIDDLILWREMLGLPLWAIERLMPGRGKASLKSKIDHMGLKIPKDRIKGFRSPPFPSFGTLKDQIDAAKIEARSAPPFRPPPAETPVIETW